MTRTTWSMAIAVVVAAGALTLETSTHMARGWWRGEAFYRARPTSYWSRETHHWRMGYT